MKTGDKRQAAILSVVAVAAIVFMGSKLVPAGSVGPTTSKSGPDAGSASLANEFDSLSTEVLGNPFSHAKLATRPTESTELPARAPAALRPYRLPGAFASDGVRPEDIAGVTRQNEQGLSSISVSAILTVGEPVAILSIDGKADIEAGNGDSIAEGITVVSVSARGVTLKIGDRTIVLRTGNTLDLNTGELK